MKRHARVLNVKYIRPNEVIWGRHKIILAENPSGPGVRFYMEGRGPTLAIRGNRKVLTSLSPPPPSLTVVLRKLQYSKDFRTNSSL